MAGTRFRSTVVCTDRFMTSDPAGLRMSPTWHMRPVGEVVAESTKDGPIERIADPVTMIDANLRYTNESDDPIYISIVVARPARSVITSNPNAISIDDGITYDVAMSPNAPVPTPRQSGLGARLKTTRSTTATPAFGRLFVDSPPSTTSTSIYVDPRFTIDVRYRCVVSTPGEWRTAAQPLAEAWARFARIRLYASPATLGSW